MRRFALARQGDVCLYIGRDGHPTPRVRFAKRFLTPGGARTWLHLHVPDFADGWYVTELPHAKTNQA